MKLAILADVHANLPALQSVMEDIQSWGPDRVIAAGDIINRGPCPVECLQLISAKVQSDEWIILRGNHEEYVLFHGQPDAPRAGPPFELHRASYWTYNKVTILMPMLHTLPLTISIADPCGEVVRITHASMQGIRDGIYPWMTDEMIRNKLGDPPVLFGVGHTHLPLIRRVDNTLVVNVGSSGLPFDGDVRPSYARLTWKKGIWKAEIVRVNYDLQQAQRDFNTSGYLDEAGPLAYLVLLELKYARSHLYQWADSYQTHVLAGELTMKQAVDEFIRKTYGFSKISEWKSL